MLLFLDITLLVSGILLITSVLLQNTGSGLGSAFGGGDSITNTRRGAEKGIYNSAIVLSVVFLAAGAARMFLS